MPLHVTVTPDIVVKPETVITADVLNRLGTPTVDIRGTLDGTSSVNIAEDAVDNAKLADMPAQRIKGTEVAGDPKDLTLGASLIIADTALKVADKGIGTAQLADGAVTTEKIAVASVEGSKLAAVPVNTLLGNPDALYPSPPEPILIGSGLEIIAVTAKVNNRTRQSNMATIETEGPHGLVQGNLVSVQGATGAAEILAFNTYSAKIEYLGTNSFKYPNTGADVTSPATANAEMRVRKVGAAVLRGRVEGGVVLRNNHPNTGTVAFSGSAIWENSSYQDFVDATLAAWVLEYTPQRTSSKLLIEVFSPVYNTENDDPNYPCLALFRDGGTGVPALRQQTIQLPQVTSGVLHLSCLVDAESTSLTRFALKRAGQNIQFNRGAAGDVVETIFKLTEIAG